MAFTFKRTLPAQEHTSVSMSPREWEVVRKFMRGVTGIRSSGMYEKISEAAQGVPWLGDTAGWESFIAVGTEETGEEVPVLLGDEVLYGGEWLPVVALSRNGREISVDSGSDGLFTLGQGSVEDHRPAQHSEDTQRVSAPYVPKVGDRVRETGTRQYAPADVLGKVGVVSGVGSGGWIKVRFEWRDEAVWLLDYEPAQVVGKEYISDAQQRLRPCTLIHTDGTDMPKVRFQDGTEACVLDHRLTPA